MAQCFLCGGKGLYAQAPWEEREEATHPDRAAQDSFTGRDHRAGFRSQGRALQADRTRGEIVQAQVGTHLAGWASAGPREATAASALPGRCDRNEKEDGSHKEMPLFSYS